MRLLIVVFFLLAGWSVAAQATERVDMKAPEIQSIQKRGHLLVAMTKSDQPPFYFVNTQGQLEGLDVLLASALAAKLEVTPVFLRDFSSFNDVVDAVAWGKADVAVSKLSRTLNRAQTVRFSSPYVVFRQGLLVNRLQMARLTPDDGLRTFIRNFRGKLGVIGKSSYSNYAKTNFPNAEVVEFPTWEEVVNAVRGGSVLAAYRDEMECRLIMDRDPQAALTLKLVVLQDQTDPIAMATRWSSTQLSAFIDVFLEDLHGNLTVEEVLSGAYKTLFGS
jgi:ABC-type amino acid transport substrate-binding protein